MECFIKKYWDEKKSSKQRNSLVDYKPTASHNVSSKTSGKYIELKNLRYMYKWHLTLNYQVCTVDRKEKVA